MDIFDILPIENHVIMSKKDDSRTFNMRNNLVSFQLNGVSAFFS